MNKITRQIVPACMLLLFLILFAATDLSGTTASPKSTFEQLSALECDALKTKGIITENNPIPCHRLRKVTFSYITDDGVIKNDGELIVFDVIAPNVASLTDELLKRKFYIAKARPIEAYGGDDQASMADNNTSAFNGRAITGGSAWSLHAYGAALDLNPLQNPYIDISEDGKTQISPPGSAHYSVNRSENRPNKAKRPGMAEDVVDLFARHGFFVWGGDWNYPIDYQHFQIGPRSFVEALSETSVEDGRMLIDRYISMYTECVSAGENDDHRDRLRAECVERVLEAMCR